MTNLTAIMLARDQMEERTKTAAYFRTKLLEMLPNVGEMVDRGFCLAGRAEAGRRNSSSSRYYHRRRWRLSHSISCQMGKKIVRLIQ
jgi:hypothetical protein